MYNHDRTVAILRAGGFVGRRHGLSAAAFRVVQRFRYFSMRPPKTGFILSTKLHGKGAMWPLDSAVTSFLVKKKVLSVESVGRQRRYRLL